MGQSSELKLNATLEFMRTLWALDHDLQRASKRMNRTLGVTGPQRLVIRVLGANPGLTAGQLAQALRIHPSTLTGILQRLGQRRLVSSVRDPKDARKVRLELTPLGKRLDAAKEGTVEWMVRRALARVEERDMESAERVLGELSKVLRADLGEPRGRDD